MDAEGRIADFGHGLNKKQVPSDDREDHNK